MRSAYLRMGGEGGRGKGEGGSILFARHALALFQIRPRAKTLVHFAREDQHPCPLPHRPACFLRRNLIVGLALHGVDLVREF